ncbi:MAG: hypothetical protein CM1200mP16_09550 [Nitrospina sp.]|nr:MAG: hypothetical protein CM1200mP16_09550 [Nitrospina sp.]
MHLANFEMQTGRYFNQQEINAAKRVCVLGATVVKNLFEESNPLGKTIKVDGKNFIVFGDNGTKGCFELV